MPTLGPTLSNISTTSLLGIDNTGPAARLLPAIVLTALSIAIILGAVFALSCTGLAAPLADTAIHLSLDTAGLSRG